MIITFRNNYYIILFLTVEHELNFIDHCLRNYVFVLFYLDLKIAFHLQSDDSLISE